MFALPFIILSVLLCLFQVSFFYSRSLHIKFLIFIYLFLFVSLIFLYILFNYVLSYFIIFLLLWCHLYFNFIIFLKYGVGWFMLSLSLFTNLFYSKNGWFLFIQTPIMWCWYFIIICSCIIICQLLQIYTKCNITMNPHQCSPIPKMIKHDKVSILFA